jgi:DNA-binding LytR/AlgR family response regulator
MKSLMFFALPNKYKRIERIDFSDILYLEGRINYTLIHLKNGKIRISPRTLLYHINNSLDDRFLRIHRAFCINRTYISSYNQVEKPDYLCLNGGIELRISRRKQKIVSSELAC